MREKLKSSAKSAAAPVSPTSPQAAPADPGSALAAPPDGYNLIRGTAGGETLNGTGASDQMYGLGGNDTINGANGADWLDGGAGNDVLIGLGGADIMTGGAGDDVFVMRVSGGHDTVLDFRDGLDLIDVTAFGGYQSMVQDGADVLITLSSSVSLRLAGVDLATAGEEIFIGLSYAAIDGGPGADNLTGGAGRDAITGFDGADIAHGGGGTDLLKGLAGADKLYGDDQGDELNGGAGADLLYGGTGDDMLYGGSNSRLWYPSNGLFGPVAAAYGGMGVVVGEAWGDTDKLYGEAGDDFIDGGFGSDMAYGGIGNDRILGGMGDDRLQGDDGDDILDGGIGLDTLLGGAGADRLTGGLGSDTLTGGAGADVFVATANDSGDIITDFVIGEDILDVSAIGDYFSIVQSGADALVNLIGNVTIRLRNVDASLLIGSIVGLGDIPSNAGYVVVELDDDGPGDHYFGTDANELIYAHYPWGLTYTAGQGGDDWLIGSIGPDNLHGGSGVDVAIGGLGNDGYQTDNPSDTIFELAGGGGDGVYTTLMNYTLPPEIESGRSAAGAGSVLIGNARDNSLYAEGAGSYVGGEGGSDIISTYSGSSLGSYLDGGAGNDIVRSRAADMLVGGEGDDLLVAESPNAFLAGGAGHDILHIMRGATVLDFVQGEDVIDLSGVGGGYQSLAQSGADTVITLLDGYTVRLIGVNAAILTADSFVGDGVAFERDGGVGADRILGSEGDDILRGHGGADHITGRGGVDLIYGGEGADRLDGDGQDTLYGEGGNDVLGNGASMLGGAGNDTYYVTTYVPYIPEQLVVEEVDGGVDTVYAHSTYVLPENVENLVGDDAGSGTLTGNALNNRITLVEGVSFTMNGADGDDLIIGNRLPDYIRGDDGADRLYGGGAGDDIFGGLGNDRLYGEVGDDEVGGGDGIDILYGGEGNDTVTGDAGADTLYGGEGADAIMGGDDLDRLYGEADNDALDGGAGNDILVGGGGADTMTGGGGNDTFRFDAFADFGVGTLDRITDFSAGDRINLQALDADVNTAGNQAFVVVGSFSNVAGQLRTSYDAGLNEILVELDVNGDGVADYSLIVEGSTPPAWVL